MEVKTLRKFFMGFMLIVLLGVLAACGDSNDALDDFIAIEVDFIVPETTSAGEEVELEAIVTYDEDMVTDARVVFEIWNIEDEERENSVKLDGENHDDGSYTVNHTFDEPGTYEMFAHTDAHDMHRMPKKQVVVE